MKCIIVDDESKARVVFKRLLEIHCPEVEVVALCENLSEARQALVENQPDLVFLDLHLPNEMGFDLIRNISHRKFALVLTTAHEEYALEAFDLHAQDYLLKPIFSQRLLDSVEKAQNFLKSKTDSIDPLKVASTASVQGINKIPITVGDGVIMIEVDQIIRVEAEGSYSKIFQLNEKPLLISKNMKYVESLLEGFRFFRVHNSHLINLYHLKKISKTDGNLAIMSDNSYAEISRRKLGVLMNYLENPSEIRDLAS